MASIEQTLRQMSNEMTAKTFAFNSSEAQKERDWSTQMSNTSHQRQVEDLKKAGLNPVLSANSGAQSYSGASASGQADNSAVGVLASIYQTKMNNDNAVKLAKMQNKNNLEMAKIQASASNYAALTSASASKYSADSSAGASRYSTDMQPSAQTFRMIDDLFKNKGSSAQTKAKGSYVAGSSILKTLAGLGASVLPAFLRRKK